MSTLYITPFPLPVLGGTLPTVALRRTPPCGGPAGLSLPCWRGPCLLGCGAPERERERELHLSSHTRLMQVLPGYPLADQEYTIRESELHVGQILVVTTRGLKDRRAFRQNKQSEEVSYMRSKPYL